MRYKRLNSVLSLSKELIKEIVRPGNTVVDCTLGNGNDAYLLLEAIGIEGSLIGFDIQQKAIDNTREKLKALDFTNYKLIKDSHKNIDNYIDYDVDFIIYNLGYLPGGDKNIVTDYKTSIDSIKKSLELLKTNGNMIIVAYPGHKEGMKEKNEIESFLKEIDQNHYNILKHEFINQINNPPILYEIEKSNKN